MAIGQAFGLLAAIADHHNPKLVRRNVTDFANIALDVINR